MIKESTISELEILYKINIPYTKEFDYYINLLLQSEQFKEKIPAAIFNLENAEKVNQLGTIKAYKTHQMNILIDAIKKTSAYENFQNFDIESLPAFKGLDARKAYFHHQNHEYNFFSIDIVNANYYVFQQLFDEKKELKSSWLEFCSSLDIHPAFANSKSFRQIVFGNLNARKCQIIMQSVITKIYNILLDKLKYEDAFVYLTHDEVILHYPIGSIHHINMFKNILDKVNVPLKFTPFSVEHMGDKRKIYIRNILNETGTEVKQKELFGCPGNQFYYYYKKYILKQPIDKRDLYFQQDDRLAMWLVNAEFENVSEEFIKEEMEKIN